MNEAQYTSGLHVCFTVFCAATSQRTMSWYGHWL